MLKKFISFFFGLVFVVGLGFVLYPTFSNWFNQFHASRVVASYQEHVEEIQDFSEYKKAAYEHNAQIYAAGSLTHSVYMEKQDDLNTYNSLLNIGDDGVMGILRIPKIDVKLPVYHSTEESVLQCAVGHYIGSSLPVGGENTHCILSGHRGLPSARLFTDLDQLEEEDMFYLEVFDEILAYKVDLVQTVLPDEVDDLDPEAGCDYVTLVTCTPYGVNTHRLLVRGSRVPYVPEEEDAVVPVEDDGFKMIWLVPIVLLLIVIFLILWRRKSRNVGGL